MNKQNSKANQMVDLQHCFLNHIASQDSCCLDNNILSKIALDTLEAYLLDQNHNQNTIIDN